MTRRLAAALAAALLALAVTSLTGDQVPTAGRGICTDHANSRSDG